MGRLDPQRVAALADTLRAKDFAGICDGYAGTWGLVDRELRHVCTERCIGHDAFAVAYPKVVIVDEAYNAGLARTVRNAEVSAFDAQRSVARWLSDEGRQTVNMAVAAERGASMTTAEWLLVCLSGHGAVAKGLSTLGAGESWPTSFVSKYLHFHNADYVIYDSVVDERLRMLLAEAWHVKTVRCRVLQPEGLPHYSNAYLSYLNRFAFLVEAAKKVRQSSFKELDHFLWNRPEL